MTGKAPNEPANRVVLPSLWQLPQDALDDMLRFLTGFDLFCLSHVSRDWYYGHLHCYGEVWQRLTPWHPQSTNCVQQDHMSTHQASPKYQYMTRHAIRFPGYREVEGLTYNQRGGGILVPDLYLIAEKGSFSFDLSFALLPAAEDTRVGGILLGAQSVSTTLDRWADYHQQFVHTDAVGNLYCSVMRHKPVVAAKLELERWYHVALVWEAGLRGSTQRVYLDGELTHTAHGQLHDEWPQLYHAQVGTGCGAIGPGICRWYPFNGLIDDFRFWNATLTDDEVRSLAGGHTTVSSASLWSMRMKAVGSARGHIQRVRSTRPTERVLTNVGEAGNISRDVIPIPDRSWICQARY